MLNHRMRGSNTVTSSSLIHQLVLAACLILTFTAPAKATFYVDNGVGGTYELRTKSVLERRYYHVVHQKYDFSCGSAALASLLTFNYGRPTQEQFIIRTMYDTGNQDKIKREGFSLLDMKNYLKSIGMRANGYHESLDKLVRVGIPAIVLINNKGYMHFVVVQGVTPNKVLYGDPALGKKIMNRKKFEAMWTNGILFVVEDNMTYARRTFNTNWAWNVKKPENFVRPMPNEDLANFTLLTSYAPNSFK